MHSTHVQVALPTLPIPVACETDKCLIPGSVLQEGDRYYEADKAVSEAVAAGESKEDLVACAVVHGLVNLGAVTQCGIVARKFTFIRREETILEMGKQPLGRSPIRPGLNLSDAEQQIMPIAGLQLLLTWSVSLGGNRQSQ
jgi:hypothetical protein